MDGTIMLFIIGTNSLYKTHEKGVFISLKVYNLYLFNTAGSEPFRRREEFFMCQNSK